MHSNVEKTVAVTREVRACFNRLKAVGDALHRDIGITASMRAVMETLYENGEQTVPQIARAKKVTRQHIQTLANRLTEAGMIATRPNPSDRRSPLIDLNECGSKTFASMRRQEKTVFESLTKTLGRCDLDATLATLGALHLFLDNKLTEGENNG